MTTVIFAALTVLVFLALLACGRGERSDPEDDGYDYDPGLAPQVVYVPPTPTPAPKTWYRYDVPLDDKLQQYIENVCGDYDVWPPLVFAIIGVESGYDAALIGDGGQSYGLMQIYQTEHFDRCVRLNAVNLLNPYHNIRVGIDYLAELMDAGHGVDWALAAYNGGPNYANELSARGETSDYAYKVQALAECLYDGVQPIKK